MRFKHTYIKDLEPVQCALDFCLLKVHFIRGWDATAQWRLGRSVGTGSRIQKSH